MNDLPRIRAFLQAQSTCYIAGHTNPDGDTIGACFGLGMALQKLGITARVLMEPFHPSLQIIPGGHLLVPVGAGPLLPDALDTAGPPASPPPVLICVDCADERRIGEPARALFPHAVVVNIDHHYTNTMFGQYNFVDGAASSACELVYRLLHGFVEPDRDIATALYAGMVCDTGGFRFNATGPDTLRLAGELISLGIPFTEIYTELIHMRSFVGVRLMGAVIDRLQSHLGGRLYTAAVDAALFAAHGATPLDMEGVVEFILNIRGAEAAALLYEKEGEIKVSLRSRRANVGAIALKLGGGGHHLASGATVQGGLADTHTTVVQLFEGELV